ncbi:MAG: hypothetical protein ACYS14_14070, partial [Planctomycetota bacterium]
MNYRDACLLMLALCFVGSNRAVEARDTALTEKTLDTTALTMSKAQITCKGKQFAGLRETLVVTEERSRPDSNQVELP